jgi:sulfite dehydrogenase (cytochrome) subunit B
MMRRLLIGGMITMCSVAARADEAVTLKDAPGRDIVAAYCSACHSLDYPRSNALFLDRKGWQSEVDKMIKAYGAPIGAGDAKTIVDYLTANYGTGK